MNGWLKKLCACVAVLLSVTAVAQNDFFFNHYMFNPSYYNAAWVGSEREAYLAAHHRSQWAGYDATLDPGGAPSTQLISLVVPVQSFISGVAANISNDRLGPFNSTQARFAISKSQSFSFGDLAVGIMPSLNVASINTDYLRFEDQGDPIINDLLENGGGSQVKPNMHLSLFYKSNRSHFVGLTVENLLQPEFNFGSALVNTLPIGYILLGGTSFALFRELVLQPSLIVRSDLDTYSAELSALVKYQGKMWGGLAYRRSESMSVLIGYTFLEDNKLKAGYSFDYILSNQDAKQPTSHEIYLRYDLPNLVFGGKKAVKTPRFAF